MKISIIVPFYNTHKYLKRCLNSIISQTFKDYEVILIDDGSTDYSYKIAERYKLRYNNIKLYKQENKGVASARNKGVLMAKGEYVAFVDSDDFIHKDYLKRMINVALQTNADVVCCNFYWLFNNEIAIKNYINCKTGLFSNIAALNLVISDTYMQSYLWNKLWKRDLFVSLNIEFPNMFFEDIATSFKLIYYANKVYIMKDSLYYYTQRSNSILHNFSFSTQGDYLKSLAIIKNFLDTHNIYYQTYKSFNFLCCKVMLVLVISLFMIHLQQKSFSSLFYNYKTAFKFILASHRFVTDEEQKMLTNLLKFE